MSIQGLPAGIYHIKYTTASQYDVNLPDAVIASGQSVDTSIPDVGVITVYGIGLPRSPTLAGADLSGSKLENVTLTWHVSPDDGAGFTSVAGYNIYRGTTHNPFGAGYGLIVSLPNGTATYTDALVGEGDPGSYFYQVCALSIDGNTSCGEIQAAKFTRPLSVGMNLISIPLIQSNETIRTVLRTVDFDSVWHYDSSNQRWKWFSHVKPYFGELLKLNYAMSVWLDVTRDSNLTVAGLVPLVTNIDLVPGWNLVGYPSFNTTLSVADLKADIGARKVEGFSSASSPYFLSELSDIDALQTGFGYWIYMDAPAVWVVDNS